MPPATLNEDQIYEEMGNCENIQKQENNKRGETLLTLLQSKIENECSRRFIFFTN